MRSMTIFAAVATTLLLTAACGKPLQPKDVEKKKYKLDGPYSGTVKSTAAFALSTSKVVAVKQVPKGEAGAQDPGLASFSAGLYPKLKEHCGACHGGQNDFPFASPGLDLAYASVKTYISADPEQSQIIKNVRASHNGVDPAWADELAPLISELATKL